MSEARDKCRPVTLPSGVTIRLCGRPEPGPQDVAALDALVTAARALHAAEHPVDEAAAALWVRIEPALDHYGTLRKIARAAGVRPAVLFRLRQGIAPDDQDRAAIERWLDRGDDA